jgi:hypothetical protein
MFFVFLINYIKIEDYSFYRWVVTVNFLIFQTKIKNPKTPPNKPTRYPSISSHPHLAKPPLLEILPQEFIL